jgi:NAD(P)H-nitrite reductase large subunit
MMTRCECWQLSFVYLLAYARRHGIHTLEELSAATGAGTKCGTCRPYLEELLRTGKLRVGDQLIDLPSAGPQPKPAQPDLDIRG